MNWKLLTFVMGANFILFFVLAHLNTGFDQFEDLFNGARWARPGGYDRHDQNRSYEEGVFLLLSGLGFIGTTFCGACWLSESKKGPNS